MRSVHVRPQVAVSQEVYASKGNIMYTPYIYSGTIAMTIHLVPWAFFLSYSTVFFTVPNKHRREHRRIISAMLQNRASNLLCR